MQKKLYLCRRKGLTTWSPCQLVNYQNSKRTKVNNNNAANNPFRTLFGLAPHPTIPYIYYVYIP